MRRLDKTDKQIINNIANLGQNDIRTIGDIISPLFKARQAALLVCDDIYLLRTDKVHATEILVLVAQIISLIDLLQKEGFLYLIPHKEFFFLQENCNSTIAITTQNSIKCSLGCFERDDFHNQIRINVDEDVYSSINISAEYKKAIESIICNFVYPTKKLHELVKNGFCFGEELRYKEELKFTKIGLYISLFALILSIGAPFYMTSYNNKYAITTIDSIQIQRIEDAILNYKNISEDLSLHVKDILEEVKRKNQDSSELNIQKNVRKKISSQTIE